jgi:prepilin-type processing-associated H-X9-DG protein
VALLSYLSSNGTTHRSLDGVIYGSSSISMNAILDGTSNTVMVGERPSSADLVYGWWYAGDGLEKTGALDFTVGAREINSSRNYARYRRCGGGPFHFLQGNIKDHCSVFHYWSLHHNGSNFAFADGSVRFLSYSADTVLPALATRAGGEVVEVP